MAREVNDVDLDKITFIKLPVYDLEGDYAGRVAVIPDQGQLLFDKIANDEPLIIAKANPGKGAVVVDDPATEEVETASPEEMLDPAAESATASAEPEVLPDWVQGTNASVKSCSS